jgi:ribosomal-protein-alanine N-acetyltransferase
VTGTIVLSRLRSEEVAQVAAVSARCFEHGAWDERALEAELGRAFAEVWVAREARVEDEARRSEVVGYAVAWFVGDDAELLTVGADPEARRVGVGRALVHRVQRSARERGLRSLVLEVRFDNAAARHLYEAEGFVTTDVRSRYYADGADACVMTWRP